MNKDKEKHMYGYKKYIYLCNNPKQDPITLFYLNKHI